MSDSLLPEMRVAGDLSGAGEEIYVYLKILQNVWVMFEGKTSDGMILVKYVSGMPLYLQETFEESLDVSDGRLTIHPNEAIHGVKILREKIAPQHQTC